jgi:hypothetical protein
MIRTFGRVEVIADDAFGSWAAVKRSESPTNAAIQCRLSKLTCAPRQEVPICRTCAPLSGGILENWTGNATAYHLHLGEPAFFMPPN